MGWWLRRKISTIVGNHKTVQQKQMPVSMEVELNARCSMGK